MTRSIDANIAVLERALFDLMNQPDFASSIIEASRQQLGADEEGRQFELKYRSHSETSTQIDELNSSDQKGKEHHDPSHR